jgi:hypothetical protein
MGENFWMYLDSGWHLSVLLCGIMPSNWSVPNVGPSLGCCLGGDNFGNAPPHLGEEWCTLSIVIVAPLLEGDTISLKGETS